MARGRGCRRRQPPEDSTPCMTGTVLTSARRKTMGGKTGGRRTGGGVGEEGLHERFQAVHWQ